MAAIGVIVTAMGNVLTGMSILVAVPLLMLLVLDMARRTIRLLRSMLDAQFERDGAIAAQELVIGDLDAERERAARMAATDFLTGAPNRMAFLENLERRIAAGTPFTVVLLDLDYFKNVNDSMGRRAGDVVLSKTLEALTADGAGYVARLGGDEVGALFPHESPAQLTARVMAMTRRLDALDCGEFGVLAMSASAGSAVFPGDATDRQGLLHAADVAMRTAKSSRRGAYQAFERSLEELFQRDTTIASLLTTSIEEGPFRVVFQPQVWIDDGSLIAAEALTRFTHPGLSMISVGTGFSVAEDRGLGTRLSHAVLQATGDAIIDAHSRMAQPLRLAVNLSPPRRSRHPRPCCGASRRGSPGASTRTW